MPPLPRSLPTHFALRCIVVVSILAMSWYRFQGHSWTESVNVVTWSLPVESDGAHALAVLPQACLTTLGLVLVSMLLAASIGIGLAFLIVRSSYTRWLSTLVTILSQFIAALPIIGIAWSCIAGLVNNAHLPIESLIPYSPPPERDTHTLAIGRELWSWLVPMWTLVLPLSGLWLASALDQLRTLSPLTFQTALNARGVPASDITWNHWFPMTLAALNRHWQDIAMIAMAWSIFVEDAFGLQGWGGFTARCVREKNITGVASALVAAAWICAAWHLISWPFRRGLSPQSSDSTSTKRTGWTTIIVLGALAFVFVLGSSNSWVSGLLLPWLTSPLPESLRHEVSGLWPRLVGDVHDAVVAVGIAFSTAIGLGWLLALIARVKAWPRTAIVDTILSGPFATFLLLLAAMDTQSRTWFWPSLALALQGGARIRNLATQLRVSPPMLASKVAGSSALRRWFTHAVPDLANELCAWAIESLGTALLWIVLIHSLVPAGTASLGNALAAARNTALTDPSIVLQTTLTTAIAVLCFWRLSRVLRAAPH